MGQGWAGDALKEAMLRLDRMAPELRPGLRVMVHDELLVDCEAGDAEDVHRTLKEAFTWEVQGVPILCDVSEPGKSWGQVSSK